MHKLKPLYVLACGLALAGCGPASTDLLGDSDEQLEQEVREQLEERMEEFTSDDCLQLQQQLLLQLQGLAPKKQFTSNQSADEASPDYQVLAHAKGHVNALSQTEYRDSENISTVSGTPATAQEQRSYDAPWGEFESVASAGSEATALPPDSNNHWVWRDFAPFINSFPGEHKQQPRVFLKSFSRVALPHSFYGQGQAQTWAEWNETIRVRLVCLPDALLPIDDLTYDTSSVAPAEGPKWLHLVMTLHGTISMQGSESALNNPNNKHSAHLRVSGRAVGEPAPPVAPKGGSVLLTTLGTHTQDLRISISADASLFRTEGFRLEASLFTQVILVSDLIDDIEATADFHGVTLKGFGFADADGNALTLKGIRLQNGTEVLLPPDVLEIVGDSGSVYPLQ